MKVITYTTPVKHHDKDLPKSYVEFVGTYGYGTYCGLIHITAPDEQVIYGTFLDDHFWEFNDNFTESDYKKAIQLASTIDGDIISYIKNKPEHLFILPRNSEHVLSFNNLNNVLAFYQKEYQYTDIYFEPHFERKVEQFSLISDEGLLDINIIHNKFLNEFNYDFSIRQEQPKYVIEKIGGWIKFDLVYKNSITISYQLVEESNNEYSKYLEYIAREINNL